MVARVPYTGDEKPSLLAALDRHRDVVEWKIEGLDEERLRRSMTPSGTNLLGMVKHLGGVELELDDVGTAFAFFDGATVSLRWAMIHVLEETIRHVGHMDILRELSDGATGDHDWG